MKAVLRRLIASLFEQQVRRLIRRHNLLVVAVGGSVGKTSTKMFIATVLREKYRVLVHEGNYNTEIGLPLSIFEMAVPRQLLNPLPWLRLLMQTEAKLKRYPYDVVVVELGTDHPGEIPHYLTYLTPSVGVTTAVTPEHMEGFPGGMDEVAAEELALAAASRIFVANMDDIPATYRARYIDNHRDHHYYGTGDEVEYSVKVDSTNPVEGTRVSLEKTGGPKLQLTLAVYGVHSAKAAAAAYAVADLMGLSIEQAQAGLSKILPVNGRMRTFAGINGSVIVDDTYNSSPEAVVAAVDALAAAPVHGRRIALMGTMNELGPDSPRYHEETGAHLAGVDLLVTLGGLANEHMGPAAVRAGLPAASHHASTSPYEAGAYLRTILGPGDVLLAKGSQNGVFAEEALKSLLADPADVRYLVRQSPTWLKLKAKQFPQTKE